MLAPETPQAKSAKPEQFVHFSFLLPKRELNTRML